MKNQLSAIRTLSRFRIYTMINIIGLAVSVAATLIIVRYIHQEIQLTISVRTWTDCTC